MCQPRRLAAVGVATRVHDELGERAAHVGLGSAGSRIGYMVRGDSACCAASCQLLFCTTGVLLQRLRSDPTLANVTHLIVDEVTHTPNLPPPRHQHPSTRARAHLHRGRGGGVCYTPWCLSWQQVSYTCFFFPRCCHFGQVHERHLDADFLLAALKVVLPQRPTLRVVMMSATLDAQKFAAYFSPSAGGLDQSRGSKSGSSSSSRGAEAALCPVVSIPGMTHPVQDFYLDDVAALTGYLPRNVAIERAQTAAFNASFPTGQPEALECDEDEDDDDEEEDSAGRSSAGSSSAGSGARYGEAAKQAKAGRALGGTVDVSCALDYKLLVKVILYIRG